MTTRGNQGGFKDWAELRAHTIHIFNETPHPITEQEIIRAYELHPDQVEKAIASLAADVANGTIRSGWAVLRKRANNITTPPSNPARASSVDREKKIMRAEQWIRAAGLHFNSEYELTDELFGDRGQLKDHPDLKTHMLDVWANHRPIGEQIERDAIARAEKWKAAQARITELKAQAQAEHDAKQTAPVDLPF